MTVTFNRNGKTFTGTVVDRGHYDVDKPESYKVQVGRHAEFWVPVADCKTI